MACYVLNDALVQLTLHIFPSGQVLAVRGVAATLLVAAVTGRRTAGGEWRALARPIMALRIALEVATALASVLALARAALPLVTALMLTAPLMIATASMALRWEPVRMARLAAVAAGLAGTLLVIRPSAQASATGMALALACAASLACRDLVTRRLPASLSSAKVTLATTFAVCMAGVLIGAAMQEHWVSLDRRETLALIGAAACSAAGNYALIMACRGVDLAVVTPYRYSTMVWSCLMGYALWRVVPDRWALAGIGVIVCAGAVNTWVVRRERSR